MPKRADRRSAAALKYRHLYKTARWQRTRADQLRKQPICERCRAAGFTRIAKVCNHIDPKSKETEEGFFAGPFSSLCDDCHDGPTQSDEKRGKVTARAGYSRAVGGDGMPTDPRHPFYDAGGRGSQPSKLADT